MTTNCELCGHPMPAGEEMFKFHGYSGPCPAGLPAAGHVTSAADGREALSPLKAQEEAAPSAPGVLQKRAGPSDAVVPQDVRQLDLREWAQHHAICGVWSASGGYRDDVQASDCTCGLTRALSASVEAPQEHGTDQSGDAGREALPAVPVVPQDFCTVASPACTYPSCSCERSAPPRAETPGWQPIEEKNR